MHLADASFGTLGCSELDVVLGALGSALDESERVGAVDSGEYKSAKQFYDTESSVWSGHVLATGSVCDNLVQNAKTLLKALNSRAVISGAVAISIPNVTPEHVDVASVVSGPLGDLKWIALAAAALGGLYVFGPALKTMLAHRGART